MLDSLITLVGNLVADPRLNHTKDGHAVASFRIASTPRRFDRAAGEWRDGETWFVNVTCWRGLAENAAATLRRGHSVVVHGRLAVKTYETREGERRESLEIDAMAVGPDLARAVAEVRRPQRAAGSAQGDSARASEAGPELEPQGASEPAESEAARPASHAA